MPYQAGSERDNQISGEKQVGVETSEGWDGDEALTQEALTPEQRLDLIVEILADILSQPTEFDL